MREPRPYPNEENYKYRERYNNFIAFMTRCRLTQINNSYKNNDKFPYTAGDLALYMQHLCNTMDPIIEDEYQSDHSVE